MTRPNLQGIELVVDGKFVWVRPGTKIEEQPEEVEIMDSENSNAE